MMYYDDYLHSILFGFFLELNVFHDHSVIATFLP